MGKNIITYTVTIGILFFLGLSIHQYLITYYNLNIPYSLKNVYLFFAVFSLIICIVFYFLSLKKKFFEQLGFIYLGVLVFKIILFSIIFYNSIVTINLSKKQSLSLLIPIVIFVVTEVYFLAKILNKKIS